MEEYNEVVASSLAAEIVGGSQACLDAVVEGHNAVADLLATSEGRRSLEETFNLCRSGSLDDELNQEQFGMIDATYTHTFT